MHLTEEVLTPVRARYGAPRILEWEGEISDREYGIATYSPLRTHDVTLFILNGQDLVARGRAVPGHAAEQRIALIRKHLFPPDVWRPPGGGVKEGEGFVEAVVREGYEETGLRVELQRYLVEARARFSSKGRLLDWRTHVLLATTTDEAIAPRDLDEIAEARWGTLAELAGPLRERLLATGRAFWRYRVALHDAALAAIGDRPPEPAA
jgi:ADP-ribose pyrophosphatase YjhB (NUDIX family)